MVERRQFMLTSLAAAGCCMLGLPAFAHNCFDHCGDGCKGLCRDGYGAQFDRDPGLKLAWQITDGKTPRQMHAALTAMFGPFPIWFVDDKAHVVILGVGDFSDEFLARNKPYIFKGHLLCDARIIRMRVNGEWQERETLDRPPRFDCGYVTV